MPQSLTQYYAHTIFTTKNRHQFINQNIKLQLYYYIIGILNFHNSPPMAIGGTDDHIHILHRLSKNHRDREGFVHQSYPHFIRSPISPAPFAVYLRRAVGKIWRVH